MNAEEARGVEAALRRWNVAGFVAPRNPADPDGEWRVYDSADPGARTDITAEALAALKTFEGSRPAAARTGTGPTRGFVLPPR